MNLQSLTVTYLAHIHLVITPVKAGFTVKLFRTILEATTFFYFFNRKHLQIQNK